MIKTNGMDKTDPQMGFFAVGGTDVGVASFAGSAVSVERGGVVAGGAEVGSIGASVGEAGIGVAVSQRKT